MRILSGIQPSGKLHIGNYFGMMRPAIELQEQGQAYLFIANYHALTTVTDPEVLRAWTWDVALDFLACGLDPERTVFFRQSDVPEVTELSWLLSIVTPMGLLERCHSYKDKTAKGITPSHGLFAYPVLMAADILAVQATVVPVGRDQKQHVEVTRDLAIKFNHQYGEIFTVPEPSIREHVAVVPGVDGQKMSKSYNNHIELFGSKKETKSRVMRIVTDSTPLEDPKDPDTCNVFALYKLFADEAEQQAMADQYRAGDFGYGTAKKALFEKLWDYFEPFRARREALAADPDFVESVLQRGAAKARIEAGKTLQAARKAMGLA
ncbi:MAG: tryptophan--tRNA ligase [Verrucomicrobia bacterium]|jgi:tryptophanyl-tRNA synthetase|nr:tryptophan--tRNA ligase [Verrucomicrobiota bacterium]MBT7067553.1 tryptophan--tRNA ligase [Verrucomicrobiota bacterium]MBT7698710.1 tryptophan--tRNA ligase [Verrucomicrobiota bacterium]